MTFNCVGVANRFKVESYDAMFYKRIKGSNSTP